MRRYLVPLLVLSVAFPITLAGCTSIAPLNELSNIVEENAPHTAPDTAAWTADAPTKLYDIEGLAGSIFEGILSRNWNDASDNLSRLVTAWTEAKTIIENSTAILQSEEVLSLLISAVQARNPDLSQTELNDFMYKISDISKGYKLSPLSDIIAINNAGRDLRYAVENKNWVTATAKIKELQNTWGRAKSNLEQFGILGDITQTHSSIEQMKNSVEEENRTTFLERFQQFNEGMNHIRTALSPQ